MCFGNDDPPPAPSFGPPPPPPEFMDVFDEVSGVQSIVATGPDGKKRRVISRLPRTPEEEKRYRAGEDLIAQAIPNILKAAQYDSTFFAPFVEAIANLNTERAADLAQVAKIGNMDEYVNQYKDLYGKMIDQEFEQSRMRLNERLTQSGRGRSTFAAEERRLLEDSANKARAEGDFKARAYAEDLAAQKLNRNTKEFGLREMGRESRAQAARDEYGLRKEQREQTLQGNQLLYGIGSQLVGQDLSKVLGSQAPQIANDTFRMQSADNMARYQADVDRQFKNYQMALGEHNARGPSWGDIGLNAIGTIGGAVLTGHPGSLAGRIGAKIF